MSAPKYYCDYCDKEFQDIPAARKRHLQSGLHHRNRRLWFDSLSHHQEPNLVSLATVPAKGVCNRFVKSGFCPFGDSCKYHHPKHNLQGPVAQGTSMAGVPENLQLQAGGGPSQGHASGQSFGMSLGNLPPSLRPPPEGCLEKVHYLVNSFPTSVEKYGWDGSFLIHKAVTGGHIKEIISTYPQVFECH